MYKKSKFNYVCKNQNDELLIYNTYNGSKSLCKINSKTTQKLFLNGEKIDNKIVEKKLISKGALVSESLDENLKLDNLLHNIISPSDLRLVLSVTEQCNLLCKYCYESHNNINLTKHIKDKILNYIKYNIHKFEELHINWFGGEPLIALEDVLELSRSFIETCKFSKRKYSASMTTNGYLLDVDTFKKLLKHRVWSYQITIDGTEKTHNKQRPTVKNEDSFNKIYENLMNIKRLRNQNFHIVIRSNLTKTIFNELDEYVDLMNKICGNDKRFSLSLCYACEWSDNLKSDTKMDMIDDRDSIFKVYEKFIQNKYNINFAFLLNPTEGACELGRNNRYFIRPNGEIHKCSVRFENKDNIVGEINGNKITMFDNYYSKIINSKKCELFYNCFYAPICKGEVCPAIRSSNNSNCPDSKKQLDSILQLLDNSNQFELLDQF